MHAADPRRPGGRNALFAAEGPLPPLSPKARLRTEMGHLDVVRRLLARGADPSIEAGGHTALSFALRRGHTAIVDLLREAAEE